jgi:hypothetical protein
MPKAAKVRPMAAKGIVIQPPNTEHHKNQTGEFINIYVCIFGAFLL